MPTPLAHGLAGIAVARTVRTGWSAWHFAALAVVITLAPDLDFVPGVLYGDPGLFHRGPTHSLMGAVILSAPIALLLAFLAPPPGDRNGGAGARFLRWYGFVLPVYTAHLILDMMAPDTAHSSGVRLLWPLTDAYFTAPIPVPEATREFFDLEFGPDTAGFFRTLFSAHAVAVYLAEALLFSPLLVLPFLAARLRSAGTRAEDGDTDRGARADSPSRTGRSRGRPPEPAADAAG